MMARRTIKKRVVTVGPQGTGMAQGYAQAQAQGGGIVPEANAKAAGGVPFGNPIKQLGDLWNTMFPKGAARH